MIITLPPLPYALDALEPFLSSTTVSTHYHKHHQSYVDSLNDLIIDTAYSELPLESIIFRSSVNVQINFERKIFNNASQVWNHSFYWNCMSGTHDQQLPENLSIKLAKYFGNKDHFIEDFTKQSISFFGSGWAWLVRNPNHTLEIVCLSNAESPLLSGKVPLLALDLWEHAYYLDYKNDRKNYVQNFWRVVDWNFVNQCLVKSEEIINPHQYTEPSVSL